MPMLSLLSLLPTARAHMPFSEGMFTITEIHAGPAADGGQWFEIRNNTAATQNLVEQVFTDTAGNAFTVSAGVLVAAGAAAVLAAPDSPVSAPVLLRLPAGFSFAPAAGRLAHTDLNGDVDAVAWDSAWAMPADAPLSLGAPLLTDTWANDLPQNWCVLPASPGAENAACPGQDRDDDGDGFSELDGDCDDADPAIRPDPGGLLLDDADPARADDDCDGSRDEDGQDGDLDGFTIAAGDCDDAEPATFPGAPEQPDGRDNDCDGVPDDFDVDLDGWSSPEGDCDDLDSAVHPGAEDPPCDGIDQGCDGADSGADSDDGCDSGAGADSDSGDSDSADSGLADSGDDKTGVAGPCCSHGEAWLPGLFMAGLLLRRRTGDHSA